MVLYFNPFIPLFHSSFIFNNSLTEASEALGACACSCSFFSDIAPALLSPPIALVVLSLSSCRLIGSERPMLCCASAGLRWAGCVVGALCTI